LNGLKQLQDHPLVKEVRGIGLLAGVELLPKYGRECARIAESEGLIVRAIGDTIAFCPPLIISEAEVHELLLRFHKTLDRLKSYQVDA
jgi:4-aminobutyrate--pyruvate transaminase